MIIQNRDRTEKIQNTIKFQFLNRGKIVFDLDGEKTTYYVSDWNALREKITEFKNQPFALYRWVQKNKVEGIEKHGFGKDTSRT